MNSGSRAFDSFLGELRDCVKLFSELLRQVQEHLKVVSGDDPDVLERVARERTELVMRIQGAFARLVACKDKWLQIKDNLPATVRHRQSVASELDELVRVVDQLQAAESECAKLGDSRKLATVRKLQDVADTKKVDATYKVKIIEDPRFVDRNE